MRMTSVFVAAFLLCACSTDNDDEASSATTIGAEVAEDYNDALDKAQAVEDQAMEQKRKLDEALEEIQ